MARRDQDALHTVGQLLVPPQEESVQHGPFDVEHVALQTCTGSTVEPHHGACLEVFPNCFDDVGGRLSLVRREGRGLPHQCAQGSDGLRHALFRLAHKMIQDLEDELHRILRRVVSSGSGNASQNHACQPLQIGIVSIETGAVAQQRYCVGGFQLVTSRSSHCQPAEQAESHGYHHRRLAGMLRGVVVHRLQSQHHTACSQNFVPALFAVPGKGPEDLQSTAGHFLIHQKRLQYTHRLASAGVPPIFHQSWQCGIATFSVFAQPGLGNSVLRLMHQRC
mmetsp:Transcript_11825/g.28138  ORF Transcript_11825/g.28138 Transcript_11825/m.28138 type:complete len:278 (+) Transcript_11825:691-1524(+)